MFFPFHVLRISNNFWSRFGLNLNRKLTSGRDPTVATFAFHLARRRTFLDS